MKQIFCLFITLFVASYAQAQSGSDYFDRRQFSIMVVPYLKVSNTEGSIIQTIEGSTVIRNAISIINKALLKADYKVEDYLEQYDIQKREKLISGNEKGLSEIIIQNAPVDVAIKFEIELRHCMAAKECDMKVHLQAVDKYNGYVYSDCQLSSQCRYSCDSAALLNAVLDVQDGGASACLAEQFDREYRKILERDGRTMELFIAIKEGCTRRLNEDCDTNANQINDCIETYALTMAKNVKVIGKTDLLLRMQLNIPLADFNATTIAKMVRQYIRRLDLPKGKLSVDETVMRIRATLLLSEFKTE